jgi:iron complex transport system substrate-binding protein
MLLAASAALLIVSFLPDTVRAEPVRAIDDRGTRLALNAPARRVVALAPSLTELIYAAGGAKSLIAVDSSSNYPPAVASLPRIGDAAGLDLERVLVLRPDLVFGWLSGNKPSDIARLERLGVKVFLSEPRRLTDIPRTLRVMGTLLDSAGVAEAEARAFERRLQSLRTLAAGARVVSVFFEVWHQPLITVNGQHLISDVLTLCGGRNVFGNVAALAPPVSLESVLLADPEVIIATDVPSETLAAWNRTPRLHAVQRQQIYELHPDLITRATPRVLEGAEKICRWLDAARQAR